MKAGNFSGNLRCTLHAQWPAAHAANKRALHAQRPAAAARDQQRYQQLERVRGLETCRRLLLAEGVVWWLPGKAAAVKSASEMGEQWLPFVVMAAGERQSWI